MLLPQGAMRFGKAKSNLVSACKAWLKFKCWLHERSGAIARLLRGNETWAEELMWNWLRDRRFSAYKFRRQHRFGEHYFNFFCWEARLNIELDGSQHGYPTQLALDKKRDAFLEARGIKVLRFWNSKLRRDQDVIRETIWRMLQERAQKMMRD